MLWFVVSSIALSADMTCGSIRNTHTHTQTPVISLQAAGMLRGVWQQPGLKVRMYLWVWNVVVQCMISAHIWHSIEAYTVWICGADAISAC